MRRLALVVVLVAAGCGSASRAPEVVSPPSPREEALGYARCLRAHGIPHPDPNAYGDFHLTPAQERALRAAGPKARRAADRACARFLKGTPPLSRAARRAALTPLRDLKACLHGLGVEVGKPIVVPKPYGRAMFGFDRAPQPSTPRGRQRQQRAQRICEKKVKLAARLDAIIAADRGENR
jgi:hypothetical protein